MRKIILAFIVLMIFAFPASATVYSDNFEDVGWASAYSITGTWGRNFDTSYYIIASTTGFNSVNKSGLSSDYTQFKADIYFKSSNAEPRFTFLDNGTARNEIYFDWVGSVVHATGVGFTYDKTDASFGFNNWYTVVINRSGGNYNVKIYNRSTNTLLTEDVAPITIDISNSNRFAFSDIIAFAGQQSGFDNLFLGYETWAVSGYVNETSGSAINGATVSYSGGSTTTNALGYYSFPSVFYGTYTFTASKIGFSSSSQSIIVNTAKTKQNFTLTNNSQTTTFVNFDKETYVINEQANVTYSITDNDWLLGFIAPYVISICDPEASAIQSDCYNTDVTSVNDSFPFLMSKPGRYTVNMGRVLGGAFWFDLGVGFTLIVSSDEALVTGATKPTLNVNATVTANAQADVHYNVGHGYVEGEVSICPFLLNDDGEYVKESVCTTLTGNVSGWTKVAIGAPGTYQLKMYDCTGDCFYAATTYTKAIMKYPDHVLNISTSDINFSNSVYSYFYGDVMYIDYQVDDTNWTSYRIFLDVHNYDRNLTGAYDDLADIYLQTASNLPWTLVNKAPTPTHQQETFYYGNNSLRLRAINDTATITIDYVNFTLSSTNQWGYNIILSGDCEGNTMNAGKVCTIQFVIPSVSLATITKAGSGGGIIYNQTLNHTITVKRMFSEEGFYDMTLQDSTGRYMAYQGLTVKKSVVEVTPVATPPSQGAEGLGTNLRAMMGYNAFWGLLIWIGAVVAVSTGSKGEDRSKTIELTAIILAAVEAVVGLWEPYTWFIVVVLILALGTRFYAARKTHTGE